MKNRILCVILVLVMTLGMIPCVSSADQTEMVVLPSVPVFAAPEADLPENAELFAYYADSKLYGYDISTFGRSAYDALGETEKAIYDELRACIEEVAQNGGLTAFYMPAIDGLKYEWTNTELGVSSITDFEQIQAQFNAQFDFDSIVEALIADCPMELYWYDKTETGGANYTYQMKVSGYNDGVNDYYTSATVYDFIITFSVSSDFMQEENVVLGDIALIEMTKETAQSVVDENAEKSDYEKMVAYKEYICAETSYNSDAANGNYDGYGNPWQLIYVFDGDPDTNVVCEGYAKAFQYLCDLGGLDCISVSGYMYDDGSWVGHMWNVVTLDGNNYLVDVTNCDEGTIGADDLLFLLGGTYTDGYYAYSINGETVAYSCDDLGLSTSDYEAPEKPEYTITKIGAGIRPKTATRTAGLRFVVEIDKADYGLDEVYTYEGADVRFGILLVPESVMYDADYDMLKSYYLDCATNTALDIPAVNIYRQDAETLKYTGVLTGIPVESYTEQIRALPYALVGEERFFGVEVRASYYDIAVIARTSDYSDESIANIADDTERAKAYEMAAALDEIITAVEG